MDQAIASLPASQVKAVQADRMVQAQGINASEPGEPSLCLTGDVAAVT